MYYTDSSSDAQPKIPELEVPQNQKGSPSSRVLLRDPRVLELTSSAQALTVGMLAAQYIHVLVPQSRLELVIQGLSR